MLKPGITLYFVRHGETDWNFARRYQGQQDIPLNATGRGQAARNGKILSERLGPAGPALDYVASPLDRARETMRIVRREMGLPPEDYRLDARLKEIHYGHWEGLLWDDLEAQDPEGFAARRSDVWAWQPRGGESYALLSARVEAWLGEVARDTVVVAHGGVSRVLRGLVLGLPATDIPALAVPQDKVLVVTAGAIDWI